MMLAYPHLFRRTWSKRRLAEEIIGIDVGALRDEYERLVEAAPRRSERQRYFVGHSGIPSTLSLSNRREEHAAIALVGLETSWPLCDGSSIRFLDYQVPLKQRRSDSGIGKIDMVGLTDRGRLVLTELKVTGHSGGNSDPPPTALMEGLRYAAIVQANQVAITREIEQVFGLRATMEPPIVHILGERTWWLAWLQGDVAPALAEVVGRIGKELDLPIVCASVDKLDLTYGSGGTPPRLHGSPAISPLRPGQLPE